MDANELRLGNFITDTGEIWVVTADTIGLIHIFSKNGSSRYLDYKPIPLTEEWLLKLGFKLSTNRTNTYYYPKNDDYEIFNIGENNIFNINDNALVNLKYVHQLQNLIYVLTNQ